MQLGFVIRAIFCAVVTGHFIYVHIFSRTLCMRMCVCPFYIALVRPFKAIIFAKLSFRVIENCGALGKFILSALFPFYANAVSSWSPNFVFIWINFLVGIV